MRLLPSPAAAGRAGPRAPRRLPPSARGVRVPAQSSSQAAAPLGRIPVTGPTGGRRARRVAAGSLAHPDGDFGLGVAGAEEEVREGAGQRRVPTLTQAQAPARRPPQGAALPPAAARGSEGTRALDAPYESLRGEYSFPKLDSFFKRRPWEVAGRFAAFSTAFLRVARVWRAEDAVPPEQRTRGAVLRAALSALGPASVKCGQTLAERPDLIGDEAAGALKALQGENTPFANETAWAMIAEDLAWSGPLAPGCPHAASAPGPPLFAHLSAEPVAAASLAQVYYAVSHDGVELALKVQRPGLLRQVALDMYVLRLALDAMWRSWGTLADLRLIADEVGAGVFRELDVHGEAHNAAEFQRRLAFLGFVRTPRWEPRYSGPPGRARLLAMEWVHGRRLSALPPPEQRRLVDMAVEASVAQLIRTGFVHADPHAGNLLLGDDGKLVFLDFGLMCTVEPHIMEAFASGVCHLLAGDWLALAHDFQDCGLVPPQFEARSAETGKYEACSAEHFAKGIQAAIEGEADGLTRFGALATGLGAASGEFRFLCPPFIILLCRTFLTLEGMANVVDPNFSIYASALPYAVRRALSPETEKGEAVLRAALLTEGGAFRWARLNEVLARLQGAAASAAEEEGAEESAVPPPAGGLDTVTGLIGAPEGAALRRVAFDANSLALARHLTSPAGRTLRRAGVKTLAAALQELHRSRAAAADLRTAAQRAEAEKEAARKQTAMRVILSEHARRLLRAGLPGLLAMAGLLWVVARVGVMAAVRAGAGVVIATAAAWWRGNSSKRDTKA